MSFMETKKRVKKLEEQVKQLTETIEILEYNYEKINGDLQFSFNDIYGKISSITPNEISAFSIIEIDNKIQNSVNSILQETSIEINNKLRETITQLKHYTDNQVSRIQIPSISKSEIERIISGYLSDNQKPEPDIDYQNIQNIIESTEKKCLELKSENTRLNNELDLLKNQITKLEQSLKNINSTAPIPASPKPVSISISAPTTSSVSIAPLFSADNDIKNERSLQKILENLQKLKNEYINLGTILDSPVYIKTVDACITKIQRLIDKNSSSSMEVSKIVGEIVKIFNSTIVKNFAKKELSALINQFMTDCSFVKKELEVGKRLSDDDYSYIGDSPLNEPVDTEELHNVILEKEHDAYIIYYKDEDGLSFRIVEGKCSIGNYSK